MTGQGVTRARRRARLAGFVLFFLILGTALVVGQGRLTGNALTLASGRSLKVSSSSHLQSSSSTVDRAAWADIYARLPLTFEANQGQADSRVKFLSRGEGYTLFLTGDEAVLALKGSRIRSRKPDKSRQFVARTGVQASESGGPGVLRIQFVGANRRAPVSGVDELPGKSNYFRGSDPKNWRTRVANYARVRYQAIYPGVDLVYYGNQRQLEYDFVAGAGVDPDTIHLRIRGADLARIDSQGNLILEAAGERVMFHQPVIYQADGASRRQVNGGYRLGRVSGSGRSGAVHDVRFWVARYDRQKPLVIDPSFSYSTYLGGSQDDFGNAVAVDGSGNAYLTGSTVSSNFPVQSPEQSSCASCNLNFSDAFITKVNASGSAMVYSTYLGGSLADAGAAIAVDASGNAYVTGSTSSTDFPTASPLQTSAGAGGDAFITKLNSTGSALVYSTYLGGSAEDDGLGIQVDSSGNAYVVGRTASTNFPLANAFQSVNNGSFDAFVSKIDSTGTQLLYSTYLGGSAEDDGFGIALASSGNVYVTGQTLSNNFPTLSAFQSSFGGQTDAFVTKLNLTGSKITLAYSTYLGGSSTDQGFAIALDSSNNAYVTGSTNSTDFPTMTPFQSAFGGGTGTDAFVSKISSSGTSLVYSTYLGGNQPDGGRSIAVDSAGRAHVTGFTSSANFPVANPLQNVYNTNQDAFLARLNPGGCGLAFSTFLGGHSADQGSGVAVNSAGDSYVTGYTLSNDFPTKAPFQASTGGNRDAFLAKIPAFTAPSVCLSPTSVAFTAETVTTTSAPTNVTLTNSGDDVLNIASITSTGVFNQTNTCSSSVPAGGNCTISITFSPTVAGNQTGVVTVTDDSAGASTATQDIAVSGLGTDFLMTVAPASATVTKGQTATYTLTLTPSASFNATVALSCSGAPAPGTCAISPSSITPAGTGNSTARVNVTTVASSLVPPSGLTDFPPPLGRLVVLLALGLIAAGIFARRLGARRAWLSSMTAAGVTLLVLAWFGCGISNPAPSSTPAGNYTITLTGTAGTLIHNVRTALTVQ
jgi:Beta-propeller repeat/Abnormal spindle-like microcephaly-assoc'd, ASPM-SPD-2-Hydin